MSRRAWIQIDAPAEGAPLQPGLACLTAHAHDPRFTATRNFQVRGDLVQRDDGWVLIPHKLVGGLEVQSTRLALIRANAGKARRFHRIAKRELPATRRWMPRAGGRSRPPPPPLGRSRG